jgi:TonB family protein
MRARALRAGAAVAALLFAFATLERAAAPQPAAPATPPQAGAPAAHEIVPPRPLSPLHADYPTGAQGDAQVVLIITVNADGTVRSARAAEGDEPFASAAVAAAAGFRFAPATRDGQPIAASIRAEIRFTALAPEPPPEAAPPPSKPVPAAASGAPAAPPAPAAVQPIEVTVHGEALAPGATSLSRAEVRLLPGAFGDPFRAIEVLPGVTPIVSGLPYFYVRGAPPGNVGYFLDGIRVPLLYHFGLGPSVVHPAIVERVDLYPGGYPARYGHFAGGIVAGETKPPLDTWHGEGVLRVFDVGGMVEAPFAGGRGAALLGGRYSYTAALLSLVQSEVKLDYWDYQGRFSFDVTPRDNITVFAFGSYDYAGEYRSQLKPECQGEIEPWNRDDCYTREVQPVFDTTFHRLDLRYTHRMDAEGAVLQAVTLGFDQTGFQADSFLRDLMIASRTQIVRRLSQGALFRTGLDITIDHNSVRFDGGELDDLLLRDFFKPRDDIAVGVYADVALPVTPRLEVTPGLRLGVYAESGVTAFAVEPRLSSRFAVHRSLRLISGIGVASQPPSFIAPGPGLGPALVGGLQRSFQSSAGVEVDLPEDVSTSLTLFQNAFFNLTDALGTGNPERFTENFAKRPLGHSLGLELTARRRLTRRLGGFLSYTLSRSTRSLGKTTQPSSFDRTHVANLALSYDFGRGYRAGGRFMFYTGIPSNVQPDPETLRRLPPFFRLDIRLEKRWSLGRTGWLSVVLEGLNATLSTEGVSESCTAGAPCKLNTFGPVTIPSLGLEGGF